MKQDIQQTIYQTNTESKCPKPPTVQEIPFIHGFLRLAGIFSSRIRPPLTPCPRCFCALEDSVHASMCFFGPSTAPNSRMLALPITIYIGSHAQYARFLPIAIHIYALEFSYNHHGINVKQAEMHNFSIFFRKVLLDF
ncbi:MAG: hypothetical protein ILA34_08230 [Bacteroidaceae bacterium]|nr:hypothetical protein [Bacteroidaceae bacterium]